MQGELWCLLFEVQLGKGDMLVGSFLALVRLIDARTRSRIGITHVEVSSAAVNKMPIMTTKGPRTPVRLTTPVGSLILPSMTLCVGNTSVNLSASVLDKKLPTVEEHNMQNVSPEKAKMILLSYRSSHKKDLMDILKAKLRK